MADADCAVAVVGGGAAGMAAALRLAAQRIDVVLIERESDIGGVPRHCGHPPFGLREFGRLMNESIVHSLASCELVHLERLCQRLS